LVRPIDDNFVGYAGRVAALGALHALYVVGFSLFLLLKNHEKCMKISNQTLKSIFFLENKNVLIFKSNFKIFMFFFQTQNVLKN
jgi:hypothetical protein